MRALCLSLYRIRQAAALCLLVPLAVGAFAPPPLSRVRRAVGASAPAPATAHPRSRLRALPFDVGQQTKLVNDFVTQRAIQTLLFLLRTTREQVKADWLGRFAGHGGLETFHGTRGLKVPWDDYLLRLLTADTEEIVVSLKKPSRRGLSPGNPYAPADAWFNYTVDIFPRDLGERVLALRSAIAAELADDLAAVAASQDEFLRSYRDAVRNGTDPRAGLVLPAALEGYDAAIGSGDSSPYRAGNYDLALRLSAHQAVFRRARALEDGDSREARYAGKFLRDFFAEHGAGFDGDGPNGVSRAFFRALLEAAPRVLKDGDAALLLDPPQIAEGLLAEQRAVTDLWRAEILPNVDRANADARRRALEASFAALPDDDAAA